MFVEITDADRDRFGEAHLARDLGAALATRLYQLADDLAAVLENVDQCAEALGETGLQAGVREHKAQCLRKAAVDFLEVALEGEIVGEIQLADARGVAGATEVLEQQCVVEFGHLRFAEPDFAADVDADPAAAHAVARRLALGHVEGLTERAQKFGETYLPCGFDLRNAHCFPRAEATTVQLMRGVGSGSAKNDT